MTPENSIHLKPPPPPALYAPETPPAPEPPPPDNATVTLNVHTAPHHGTGRHGTLSGMPCMQEGQVLTAKPSVLSTDGVADAARASFDAKSEVPAHVHEARCRACNHNPALAATPLHPGRQSSAKPGWLKKGQLHESHMARVNRTA